ncbi:hypothetical protein BH10PSE1_BH10PSE1_27420 [soil metagenome]
MSEGGYRFDRFRLDPENRLLLANGAPVDLNARYLDALTLLVRERGKLVSKTRFLDEVWRSVPVTDEALTQCIRTLRRQLGDDAARPRFIETVPKHGYRFIAAVVETDDSGPVPAAIDPATPSAMHAPLHPASITPHARVRDDFFHLGRAGMLGGGAAGLLGGVVYGALGVSDGGGGVSSLLVIACLTLLVGLMGGAGVGFGIAAAVFAPNHRDAWTIIGGAVGGLLIGAVVKLVGLDAFDLLFGQSPGGITGGAEGLVLGGGVGLGAFVARRMAFSSRRAAVLAGLCTAVAGVLIAVSGGRLMGGSLALLAERFPQSHLRLDHLGALFGESGFGPISRIVTAGLEGLLFGGFVVAALTMTRRRP